MTFLKSIVAALAMTAAVMAATVTAGQLETAADIMGAKIVTEARNDEIAPADDEIGAGWTEEPDTDYILRVITAEGGTDQLVCNGVVQCLYNACQRDEWAHSVEEILVEYRYTGPADWISDEARNAWDAVFCSGVTFVDFGDALYFYAPAYCDSPWHESQRFVAEVSGVRFFEEVGG